MQLQLPMDEGFVTLGRFPHPEHLLFACHVLEQAGIPCHTPDELTDAEIGGLYIYALGGMRLQVPASQAERARNILRSALRVETLSHKEHELPQRNLAL